MQNLPERLLAIKQKVQQVLHDNEELVGKLQQANEQIITLEASIEKQKSEIEMLQEQNKNIKLAKNLSSAGADNYDVKIKINQVLKEIDKCIDILSDELE